MAWTRWQVGWQAACRRCRAAWHGLLVCLLVALAARFLADHYGAPVMLMALLLGMALNVLSSQPHCQPGIDLAARQVLRWGVALLGLRVTVEQVLALGWSTVLMVGVSVPATIGIGLLLARALGLHRDLGLVSGAAVGICGASAALALAACLPRDPERETLRERDLAWTVMGVSILSTLAMLAYPMLAHALGLGEGPSGIFLGASIHDVAQVVGAAYSVSAASGDTAILTKLLRVAMLVPVLVAVTLVLAQRTRARRAQASVGANSILADKPAGMQTNIRAGMQAGMRDDVRADMRTDMRTNMRVDRRTETPACPGAATPADTPLLPGFALAFVVLVLLQSALTLPSSWLALGQGASQWALTVAMAAIGLKAQPAQWRSMGWRPVLLLVAETVFLAALVLAWLGLLEIASV